MCKLLENLKFCLKNRFSEKMTKLRIWIFVPKINNLLSFLCIDFLLDFQFSRQKLSKFNCFQFLIILFWIKITIFGAKIQIIQVIFFPLKILINHAFLARKFKFRNLDFLEIEFLDILWFSNSVLAYFTYSCIDVISEIFLQS